MGSSQPLFGENMGRFCASRVCLYVCGLTVTLVHHARNHSGIHEQEVASTRENIELQKSVRPIARVRQCPTKWVTALWTRGLVGDHRPVVCLPSLHLRCFQINKFRKERPEPGKALRDIQKLLISKVRRQHRPMCDTRKLSYAANNPYPEH